MIDIEALNSINKFQSECDDIDLLAMTFDSDCIKTMEALGDDEIEIVKFIEEVDNDMLLFLSQVIEHIFAKFPDSEAIDKALDKVVEVMKE